MSVAEMKARLRKTTPITPPLLGNRVRITDAVLSFNVRTGFRSNIVCIQLISGHALLVSTAIESIKNWKFRPAPVGERMHGLFGPLIISVSVDERGLRTRVLKAAPPNLATPVVAPR